MKQIAIAVLILSLGAASPAHPAPANYFPATIGDACSADKAPVIDLSLYADLLSAASEPPMYSASHPDLDDKAQTIRLIGIRSFHEPIIVRVELSPRGASRLVARRLSGVGGYDAKTVVQSVERRLDEGLADRLRAQLANPALAKLAAVECGPTGKDGARWIIETHSRGHYHFVDRQSPKSGEVRDIGEALLGLTAWRIEHIY